MYDSSIYFGQFLHNISNAMVLMLFSFKVG